MKFKKEDVLKDAKDLITKYQDAWDSMLNDTFGVESLEINTGCMGLADYIMSMVRVAERELMKDRLKMVVTFQEEGLQKPKRKYTKRADKQKKTRKPRKKKDESGLTQ